MYTAEVAHCCGKSPEFDSLRDPFAGICNAETVDINPAGAEDDLSIKANGAVCKGYDVKQIVRKVEKSLDTGRSDLKVTFHKGPVGDRTYRFGRGNKYRTPRSHYLDVATLTGFYSFEQCVPCEWVKFQSTIQLDVKSQL